MKVTFYGVKMKVGHTDGLTKWQWSFTLDKHVDVQHWAGQLEGGEMVELAPKISLGQAFLLRDALSEITQGMSIKECEGSIHKILQQLKLADDIQGKVMLTEVPLVESERLFDRRVLNQLKEQLLGRALLQEELMDLLHHMQLEHIAWRSYMQKLYLQGDVVLLNGVTRGNKDYTCQRCGGGGNQLFWSYCESCQSECPYCEACLNMGRTRYCSLLIQGLDRKEAAVFYDYPQLSPQWRESSLAYLSAAQREATVAGLEFLEATRQQQASDVEKIELQKTERRKNESRKNESRKNERFNIVKFNKIRGKKVENKSQEKKHGRHVASFLVWAVTVANYDYIKNIILEKPLDFNGFIINFNATN